MVHIGPGAPSQDRIDSRRNASRVYVIAATPFLEDGASDLASIDRLVDFHLSCGVSGMTILGMMGEAAKLSSEESDQVLQVQGRIPVVVGVSSPAPTR
jgi:4-hydroxy-tetrahydrodipicolinate synthase